MILFIEQLLNGLQYGAFLFLLASGLTLVFGIMGVINLTHGTFYMIGAYCGALTVASTGSFLMGLLAAMAGAGLYGLLVESAWCDGSIIATISTRFWRRSASSFLPMRR